MISGFKIGNFKAFSDTQYIPIRPLTLIFGPNSSGKSSLIHGLILAHQALQKGDLDVHRTVIGGESVDLGGFNQYVFNRDTQRQVDWALEIDATKLDGRLGEIFKFAKKITVGITIGMAYKKVILEIFGEDYLLKLEEIGDLQMSNYLKIIREDENKETKGSFRKELPLEYRNFTVKEFLEILRQPQLTTYRIEADSTPLLKMSLRRSGFLQLDTLNNDHPVFQYMIKALLESSTTTQITSEDLNILNKAISDLVSEISADAPKFLPKGIRREKQTILRDTDTFLTISRGRREEDLIKALNLFFPRLIDEIIKGLTEAVEEQLNRFQYLGPFRSYPPRHLAFSQYHDPNWFAGGGYAWEEVRKNPDLRKKVNEWLSNTEKLSTPYELVIKNLLTIDDLEKHYSKIVDKIEGEFYEKQGKEIEGEYEGDVSGEMFEDIYNILNNLKTIQENLAEVRELVLLDKRTQTMVSHRDVGVGISQVLPVLVSAYGNKEALIAIEQPEIHLHPALQAELGDVFINSSLGEDRNTFILETHSEHLLLRIFRRIRETAQNKNTKTPKIAPDDISLLYVEPTQKGAIVRHLRVDERGHLIDRCPGGFFEEDFEELF